MEPDKKSPTALEAHPSTFPPFENWQMGRPTRTHRGKGTCPKSYSRGKARTRVSKVPGQELLGLQALSLPAFSPSPTAPEAQVSGTAGLAPAEAVPSAPGALIVCRCHAKCLSYIRSCDPQNNPVRALLPSFSDEETEAQHR